MAINKKNGFTLLIAVIFMSVVLSIGLALGSLGYKQAVLASTALSSQNAFYAADAGLECALRADEQDNQQTGGDFAYGNYDATTPESVACGGGSYPVTNLCYNNNSTCPAEWVLSWTIPLAYANPLSQTSGTETRCAVVTVYKPSGSGVTYLFSQGYDVACAEVGVTGIRYASRGLSTSYSN